MEDHKLQALHDTLSKLQGRKGLGTSRQYSWQKESSKATSELQPPSNGNPLHSYFHPEGEHPNWHFLQHGDGDGRVIKRKFDDIDDGDSFKQREKKERKKAEKKAARKAAKLEAKRLAKLEEKRQAKRAAKANKESETGSDRGASKDRVANASTSVTSDACVGAESARVDQERENGKKRKKKKRKGREGPVAW
jgi:hypothetical protein